MRLLRALYFVGFLAASVQQARAADGLCDQLSNFVRAQMSEMSDNPSRYWSEFHWGQDAEALWSWGCRHSSDASSTNLCAYLMENTSREFRSLLPIRTLTCFGYRFPKHAAADWNVSDAEFRHEYSEGNWLVVEVVSKPLPEGESAVRFSVETINKQLDPDELPAVNHFEADGQS